MLVGPRCSLALLGVLFAAAAVVAAAEAKSRASVPIRGNKNLELNCPSVAPGFVWPVGTLRCEACRAVMRSIEHRIFSRHQTVDEALEGDELCAPLVDTAWLRQRKNGLRYFYVSGVDEPPQDASADRPTFHNALERKSLPCAAYLLKQRCYSTLERADDALEAALAPTRKVFKQLRADSEASDSVGQAREALRNRLEAVCRDETSDCRGDRAMAAARTAERERFLKYEAKYGNDKFKYVEDENTPGLLVRNPFAKGGEREKENELLFGDDRTDEDDGYHDLG